MPEERLLGKSRNQI